MEIVDGVGHILVDGAVVGGGVALAEEVALHGVVGTTEPLPVDLVKVVRLEDEAAHDGGAGGGTCFHRDIAEHDVLGGADRRGIGGLADRELGTVQRVVRQRGAFSEREEIVGALGEVDGQGRAKGRVRWASYTRGVSHSFFAVFSCLDCLREFLFRGERRESDGESGVSGLSSLLGVSLRKGEGFHSRGEGARHTLIERVAGREGLRRGILGSRQKHRGSGERGTHGSVVVVVFGIEEGCLGRNRPGEERERERKRRRRARRGG